MVKDRNQSSWRRKTRQRREVGKGWAYKKNCLEEIFKMVGDTRTWAADSYSEEPEGSPGETRQGHRMNLQSMQ